MTAADDKPATNGKQSSVTTKTRKKRTPGIGMHGSRRGRPRKRTPELELTLHRALKLGLDWKTAARLVDILPETLRVWRNNDADFSASLEKAKAEGIQGMAAMLVNKANAGNVTAMIFWLKTRSEEFRER